MRKRLWTTAIVFFGCLGCEVTPDDPPLGVPDEWYACTAPSDCALFEAGCCDHCNGGEIISVNACFEAQAKARLKKTCSEPVACTERACAPRVATCDAGKCGSKEDPNFGKPCIGLDQAACEASSACRPIMGAPAAETCIGNYDNWMTLYSGCMEAIVGCGDAETCAVNPASGQRTMFPDTCTPSGWAGCDCTVGSTCAQGALTEPGQVCVQAGTTSGSVQFNVQPKGCFSSSCTVRHDVACSVGIPANNAIELSALFCLCSNADPNQVCTADCQVCTADCGGGGVASCPTTGLADGTYTAKLGDIELTFTLPLTGSECAGDPFAP